MIRSILTLGLLAAAVAGCTSVRDTTPQRSATEELLISTAADRAADGMTNPAWAGKKIFIDTSTFDGTDAKYATGAITDSLLRQGALLQSDKKTADIVVMIRAGALSIDEDKFLIGVPAFSVPVPLAGGLAIPQIALYDHDTKLGVAKFAATGYSTADGKLFARSDSQLGFAHGNHYTVLFFVSWDNNDILPKHADSAKQPPSGASP